MTTKDTAEGILKEVISEVVEREESGTLEATSSINLNTSSIDLVATDNRQKDKMASKEEDLVKELEEQKRLINLQMYEIQKTGDENTQNQIYLRNLRMKRRLISHDLRTTLEKINEEKYEEEFKIGRASCRERV